MPRARGERGYGPSSTVHWGSATGLGLLAAFVGGAVWGFIGLLTGYLIGLVAIALGLFVAFAVRKGAGRVTLGVIVLAALLTLFSVFVGEFLVVSVIVYDFGGTILDAIRIYPLLFTEAPAETLMGYGFGMLGVLVSVRWLAKGLGARPRPEVRYDRPLFAATRTEGASVPAGTAPSAVPARVVSQSATHVMLEFVVPGPEPHKVQAAYSTMTGAGTVDVDGKRVSRVRVWGREKKVNVPVGTNPPHNLGVRYHGAVRPRIDLTLDEMPIS